ncbi:MAG: tetratricopeptide (TPR) repeat protein [Myxococcota bacterium]|jgi:tetratricopeptide (TPR) repeat protein
MVKCKLIAVACFLCLSCSQAPTPELPLGVAQDLQHAFAFDVEGLLEKARNAEADQQYRSCLDCLQSYASYPQSECDASFWQWQARIAEKLHDAPAALHARQQWLEFTPDDPWLRIDLANDYSNLQRLEEALSVLQVAALVEENQKLLDDAQLYLLEHNELYEKAALLCMEFASKSKATQSKVYYQKASMLFEKSGNLQAATEAISLALSDQALSEVSADELQRLRSFELGQPKNVADARRLLYLQSNAEYRLIGIRYLIRGRYPDDLQDYIAALSDSSVEILEVAISQITRHATTPDLAQVEAFLQHQDRRIRLAAIRAYESLGGLTEAQLILPLAESEDREMFRAWRLAMEKMCGHTIGVDLDPDLASRQSIIEQWQQYLSQ